MYNAHEFQLKRLDAVYDVPENDNFSKDYDGVKWSDKPIIANPLLFFRDYWSAKTWIKWHTELEKRFGNKRANEVFIEWFSKAPPLSPTTDFRTFNKEFIKYAKDNGFYEALFEGLGGLVGKTAGAANKTVTATGNVVKAAGNVIESTGETVLSFSKNFKLILFVVFVLVVFYFLSRFKPA